MDSPYLAHLIQQIALKLVDRGQGGTLVQHWPPKPAPGTARRGGGIDGQANRRAEKRFLRLTELEKARDARATGGAPVTTAINLHVCASSASETQPKRQSVAPAVARASAPRQTHRGAVDDKRAAHVALACLLAVRASGDAAEASRREHRQRDEQEQAHGATVALDAEGG